MARIARISSALEAPTIQARALSTVASRGEPPRRSQVTKDGLPLTLPAKFRGLGPGDRQERIDLTPEAGPDGFEPHEGQ